jgi:hypothetical protein
VTIGEVDALDATFAIELPSRPYPGLRPFEKHEWPIFFGRERMADAVVADIVQKCMLVVHGDSGCGKSSLVRAAVLPRLEQEHARCGIRWRTCAATPGEAPLWNLARAGAAIATTDPAAAEALTLDLRRAFNAGPDAPARVAALLGADATNHVCVLIDQFEELFAQAVARGPEEAKLLTGFCTALYANAPPGLHVVLTMRSEFLGACARFGRFAETVNATQYLLPRMQHEDLLRAIREPARLYEGEVSRALAERLIADGGGEQDELPLIQHGLMLLHREHATAGRPWRLDLEHYRADRGLKGLLSDHADAVMADAERPVAGVASRPRLVEDVFRALTDINADRQAVRRPLTLRQLLDVTGADEATLRHALDLFRADGVSLVRPYGHETVPLDERVDISHEALIRCWRRVADSKEGWLVREFRNGLVWRALLVQADSFERDRANVLTAATTEERARWLRRRTRGWAERYGGGWDRVQALVAASEEARRLQKEKEQADRERDERARLREQRFRYVSVAGALLLVLFVAAVYLAVRARQERAVAEQERRVTRAELEEAFRQREALDAARARGEALILEAQQSAASLRETLRTSNAAPAVAAKIQAVADQLVRDATEVLPPSPAPAQAARVYVHITNAAHRAAAIEFGKALEGITVEGARLIVPGVELVKSAPSRPALRCFQATECAGEAREILEAANQLLSAPQLQLQDLSRRYGASANSRPRHYEIWFTGGLTLRAASSSSAPRGRR